MRVSILFIMLFTNIFAQISYGGSPKFYNRQESVDFITPDRDNLIDRGFAPMVFQFGDEYHMNINSIWVNEMKAGDYNPVHIHKGTIFTGLSSVMILKLPKDYGPELTHPEQPMNGRLQILGNVAGQFAITDYSPKVKIGDFYIFPYDMRHVVYPFSNKKAKRRTLVCNMDVAYNPITSRTAQ